MKTKKDDPLLGLYQIDEDSHFDEREALFIMTSILEDIENYNVIRDTLRDIVFNDEVLGLNILNRLDALVQGLKKEHMSRVNRAWNRRFITAFENVHL
jgi:hypothetical protein